jgi:hypothetical protein
MLKVEPAEITSLIEQGKLRIVRIGDAVRIRELDLENCMEACATPSVTPAAVQRPQPPVGAEGSRWCHTFAGKAKFRVIGSIKDGASIWPGQVRYPLRFSGEFFAKMLTHFKGREVPVGLNFQDPERGSLGDYIQRNLPTKMNPAAYVGGLLVDGGLAERSKRGYIRFFDAKGGRR